MPALEPLAFSPRDAAAHLSISKRTFSRLIAAGKIAARKDGVRTLVDVAPLKAYYAAYAAENRSCAFPRRRAALKSKRGRALASGRIAPRGASAGYVSPTALSMWPAIRTAQRRIIRGILDLLGSAGLPKPIDHALRE